jgi:hypothetical protein
MMCLSLTANAPQLQDERDKISCYLSELQNHTETKQLIN